MPLTDAFWHLMNFFAPALGLGVLSAALARLVWRRELRHRRFLSLSGAGSLAALLAQAGGLVVFERDGRMATYAAMVVACAAAIAWFGFRVAKR